MKEINILLNSYIENNKNINCFEELFKLFEEKELSLKERNSFDEKIYFMTKPNSRSGDMTFYIYCLIVDHKAPDEYLETRTIQIYPNEFEVQSYGRYFFLSEIDTIEEGKIYVLPIQEFENKFAATVSSDNYKIFNNYVVVYW